MPLLWIKDSLKMIPDKSGPKSLTFQVTKRTGTHPYRDDGLNTQDNIYGDT